MLYLKRSSQMYVFSNTKNNKKYGYFHKYEQINLNALQTTLALCSPSNVLLWERRESLRGMGMKGKLVHKSLSFFLVMRQPAVGSHEWFVNWLGRSWTRQLQAHDPDFDPDRENDRAINYHHTLYRL